MEQIKGIHQKQLENHPDLATKTEHFTITFDKNGKINTVNEQTLEFRSDLGDAISGGAAVNRLSGIITSRFGINFQYGDQLILSRNSAMHTATQPIEQFQASVIRNPDL